MKTNTWIAVLALVSAAQPAMAVQPVGTPVGQAVGSVLGIAVGSALPIGLGGVAVIAALGLVVGVQLIKRKQQR